MSPICANVWPSREQSAVVLHATCKHHAHFSVIKKQKPVLQAQHVVFLIIIVVKCCLFGNKYEGYIFDSHGDSLCYRLF